MRLDGRIIIVTGAAGGIGAAAVATLRALGATVIGADIAPGSEHVLDVARQDQPAIAARAPAGGRRAAQRGRDHAPRAGEIVIQRATNHVWHNRPGAPCRFRLHPH